MLEIAKDLIFWMVIIAVCIVIIRVAIDVFFKPRTYDGVLLVGKDHENGKDIYRLEIDIPFDEMSKRDDILIKVEHTRQNLGINKRLYDLEADDISKDR